MQSFSSNSKIYVVEQDKNTEKCRQTYQGIAFSVRRGKDSERMFQGHTVRERSRVGHCLHSEARFFPRFSRAEKQV